jgi:rhodanese-related sulfurtransferase
VKLLSQAALVAIAGSLAGLAANALSPHPAVLGRPAQALADTGGGTCQLPAQGPLATPRISVPEAEARCTACTAGFVDAREARDYEAGHVVRALHLAPGEPGEDQVVAQLASFPLVVVYDGQADCGRAEAVARRLKARGLKEVRVLTGAWPAWLAAGGPGVSGPCELCQQGAR